MNEEMQNWKEQRIAEYAKLVREEAGIVHAMDSDPRLNELSYNLKNLEAEIEKQKAPFIEKIAQLQHEQAGIKLELVEKWDIEEKVFDCTAGVATLRITKSLRIKSKEKLVAFLELNKKLSEFIKSFEITKLRKIKDAGMLGDEICIWDEKKNVSIKILEGE